MTDKEVQDIFVEELAGKSTRKALMASQNRIAVQILAGLVGPEVDDEVWGLLKDTAYAKSRLCLFSGIAPDSIINMNDDALKEVISLHKHWLRVMCYFYDNYEGLNSEKFKELWPKDVILDIKDELAKKYEKLGLQFATTKTILLNHQDFPLMDQAFNWALLTILGNELFKQFMEEFNKTAVLLRTYKTELLSPSA